MKTFLWLALALPAMTDDFFTNLILVLVVPVIVVVGGLFVVKYPGAGMMQQAIKILLATSRSTACVFTVTAVTTPRFQTGR
jgi:putative effector of murein hydrolase LrgA (UPF0299 family)